MIALNRGLTRGLAGTLAGTLLLSGCGLGQGLYNAPLPGGADLGGHPYTITAEFSDALDLVPQSGVKVNDVAVGRVTKVSLERNGRIADVQVEINGNVRLPANAVATIQQTSLLGEKYVALAPPLSAASTGRLRNGDRIDVSQTSDGVEVEQVFGALSLLLNGGGIGQLHEIAQELNTFSSGHEGEIRRFFSSVRRVVGQINVHRSSITDALDALADLSGTLRSNNAQIARVLRAFAPGIAILANQRKQLIALLTSLNRLSTVTVRTLNSSKEDIVADLQSLAPILQQLAAAGSSLPRSLQVLATYPFTDAAVRGIKGDYLNGYVTPEYNTPGGVVITTRDSSGSARSTRSGTSSTPPPALLPATSSAAPGLPSTLSLTPSASPSTQSSSSGSGSASASGSPTGSGSGSGSSSGSGSAAGSGSGSSSAGSSSAGSSSAGSSSAGSSSSGSASGAASSGSSSGPGTGSGSSSAGGR